MARSHKEAKYWCDCKTVCTPVLKEETKEKLARVNETYAKERLPVSYLRGGGGTQPKRREKGKKNYNLLKGILTSYAGGQGPTMEITAKPSKEQQGEESTGKKERETTPHKGINVTMEDGKS